MFFYLKNSLFSGIFEIKDIVCRDLSEPRFCLARSKCDDVYLIFAPTFLLSVLRIRAISVAISSSVSVRSKDANEKLIATLFLPLPI